MSPKLKQPQLVNKDLLSPAGKKTEELLQNQCPPVTKEL
jgi:hypothetical protein